MISDAQKAANAAGAIATGLLSLIIPVPLTTVQWANKHYYLPKESSYTPGRWETLPFQVGIMNCMGNDLIRTVNLIKSARVGYTKMLLGVEAYFIERGDRWRNCLSEVKKTRCFPGAAGKRCICLWQAGDHHAKNPQSAGRVSV